MSISLQFFDQRESKTLLFARNSLDFFHQFPFVCLSITHHLQSKSLSFACRMKKIRSSKAENPFFNCCFPLYHLLDWKNALSVFFHFGIIILLNTEIQRYRVFLPHPPSCKFGNFFLFYLIAQPAMIAQKC